jgi:hypothetical protein
MAAIPTRAEFLASTPGSSFVATPVALIDSALREAAQRTSNLYQSTDLAQQAVILRAAILLLRHPKSLPMRQANPDQIFVWEDELKGLQTSGMLGLRVF